MIHDSTVDPILPLLQAVGKIPSGIFILTTGQGPDATGVLVSLVQQISMDPLYIGVAIKNDRPVRRALAQAQLFVLNICHAGDKTLLRKYAKGADAGDAAFSDVRTRRSDTGGMILLDACAFIECELAHVLDFGGDHTLYVGAATSGGVLGDGQFKPMVHIRHDGSNY